MKIDFVYIINLNTPNEEIIKKIQQVSFPHNVNYYIFPAISGWEILKDPTKSPIKFKSSNWWNIEHINNFYNRDVTPGEMGCTLSHYQCIEASYSSGYNNILILEEDFVPLGKFPTLEMFKNIPEDASLIYLDRNGLWGEDKEERINKYVTKVGYSYNNHAYIVTRKGMKEVLDSNILNNIIPLDEFFPAINGTSDREDAVKIFHNPNFQAYSFNGGYFNQSSNRYINSLTEFPPEILNVGKTGDKTLFNKSNTHPITSIQDDSNWDEWCKKYIQPMVRKGEYKLLVDEPSPNIYTFPFFTKMFCDEIIELSEKYPWKNDRHEFYPTTDNLLEVLGMDKIYNKVINTFVRPLAIWAYELEGKSWNVLRDESFIIRYRQDEQSHLSLHHDLSNITTLVNLNSGEFKGGGTYFPKYKLNVNPTELGVMTLHPGNITHKHGARPVTEGTRYVIVSFIKCGTHI
tara:strand:+ start:769 stop:2148 length:1380 start_codon:yes stop_codon:yes gene_type:complete